MNGKRYTLERMDFGIAHVVRLPEVFGFDQNVFAHYLRRATV
jgi:hypothetical protein